MLKLRDWLFNKLKVSDQVLSRWESKGLLYGLDSYKKNLLANLFDKINKYMDLRNKNENTEYLFPIARSTYISFGHYIINIPAFCEYVITEMKTRNSREDGIRAYEINTGKQYNQEEFKTRALLRNPDIELGENYLGIDISAEVAQNIAREVARLKI